MALCGFHAAVLQKVPWCLDSGEDFWRWDTPRRLRGLCLGFIGFVPARLSCADGKLGLARGHDRGAKLGGEAQVEATLERDWEDEDFTWNGSRILGWKTAGWGGGSVTRSGSPTPSPGVYNTIPGTRDGRTEHFLHGGRMRRGCKDGDLPSMHSTPGGQWVSQRRPHYTTQ